MRRLLSADTDEQNFIINNVTSCADYLGHSTYNKKLDVVGAGVKHTRI